MADAPPGPAGASTTPVAPAERGVPRAWQLWCRGLVGAVLGGIVGYGVLWLVWRYLGLFMMALPGAAVGLGCGWATRRRSWPMAIVCALGGALMALLVEWSFFPFAVDHSWQYFVGHLTLLSKRFWIQLLLSVIFSGYFGLGRDPAWWQHDPAYQAAQRQDRA